VTFLLVAGLFIGATLLLPMPEGRWTGGGIELAVLLGLRRPRKRHPKRNLLAA